MNKIRVLLAEDHTVVRKGIRFLLESEPSIDVVGEAKDGVETIEQTQRIRPDIVLVDITMPHLNGLESIRRIKGQFRNIRFIILTMHSESEFIVASLQAGALGYVLKSASPGELISAIHAVYHGDTFISLSIPKPLAADCIRRAKTVEKNDNVYNALTPREREVLQLLAEGNVNREVAEVLSISVKTVETHRANLMNKLNIDNQVELVKFAIREGIISLTS